MIEYFVKRLDERGIPVVPPPGGLACHVDASRFVPHILQRDYPAGSLTAAIYLAPGVRSMERGTVSMERDEYAVDRLEWLYNHRDLVGGLEFTHEPPVLRFFFGKLRPKGEDWGLKLVEAFNSDFGSGAWLTVTN